MTYCSVGVIEASAVMKIARYFRYRLPLNCASDCPLLKTVVLVPSGPTKLNGPVLLSLAAAWKRSVVRSGTVVVHDSVDHGPVAPAGGLASLNADINSPDAS